MTSPIQGVPSPSISETVKEVREAWTAGLSAEGDTSVSAEIPSAAGAVLLRALKAWQAWCDLQERAANQFFTRQLDPTTGRPGGSRYY